MARIFKSDKEYEACPHAPGLSKLHIFLHYISNFDKFYDQYTFTAKCARCGGINLPPKLLILYVELERIFRWIIIYFFATMFKRLPIGTLLQLGLVGAAWFCIWRIIPALIACLCKWNKVALPEEQEREFIAKRSKAIEKYNPIYNAVVIISGVVTFLAICYIKK